MQLLKKNVPAALILLLVTAEVFQAQTISNNLVIATFDKNRGTLSAFMADGNRIFERGICVIHSSQKVYTGDSENYTYKVTTLRSNPTGPEMFINGTDRNKIFNYIMHIRLPADESAIVMDVTCRNISDQKQSVMSIEPLRLLPSTGGALYFNDAGKCLTNGAMYYDAGTIHSFSERYIKPEPYGETKGGKMSINEMLEDPYTVQSWWNIALFNNDSTHAMSIGYLHNPNSLGRIAVNKTSNKQLSLIAESVFNAGFTLYPSANINSDKLAVIIGDNTYSALELYASLMLEQIKPPSPSIVNGWCNWFYTLDDFGEDEILQNANFAAIMLKPYGLEYIQIDEGFQTLHGEWQGNIRFPHGLKWLCDSIKKLGLKPGIWIAPYVVSEETAIFKQHPDWFVKGTDGKPLRIGPWPSDTTEWYRNESPKRYCLDITHPDAEQWQHDLFDTIVNRWGFEMIKIDFVAWTVFSAPQFYKPDVSPAQAYIKTMSMLREIAGEKCHILDCGPGHISAGYINSMRVEYDQNYGYAPEAWGQYFKGSSCSAGAAGKRYFYHNKSWINDIDHVCIDLLTYDNARAVATLIGLSGGNTMSGDRLVNLDAVKLDILQKIFPATIEQGWPVDLSDRDPQMIFDCKISRPFARWDLLAFFNPDPYNSITRQVDLDQIGLDPGRKYLCFDFWNQRFAGEISRQFETTVNPGSVSLFSLREARGYPQVIGTNRHVKMGAVEIENESFDQHTLTLSVTSTGPENSKHSVYVYIPKGYNWSPHGGKIYSFSKNVSMRKTENNLLRIDLLFDKACKIIWTARFDKN